MAYPNRSDLRNPAKKIAVQAAKGQTYGNATAQVESQRAVPMGPSPTSVQPQTPTRTPVAPGGLGNFNRPTERPGEPTTAGVNFGAGPNAAQAGVPSPIGQDQTLNELQAIQAAFPNDDLADLIDNYIRDGF